MNEVKSKYRKRLGKSNGDQNFDEDVIPPNWDIAEKHRVLNSPIIASLGCRS